METANQNGILESSITADKENGTLDNTADKETDNKDKDITANKPWLFKKGISGNPTGSKKRKPFSIREDLINSLRQIRTRDKKLYNEIIASYWRDPKMRQFLLEIVDGKARQSMDIGSIKDNPVKMVVIAPMTAQMIDDPQTDTKQLPEPDRA